MEITNEMWKKILEYYPKLIKSSMYCSIASVDPNGNPNVTPIGTLFLEENKTGIYFDMHTGLLANSLDINPQVCILMVNTSRWFWLISLLKNRFIYPCSFKLSGIVSIRRKATEAEKARFEKKINKLKRFNGYKTLWANHNYVREIKFNEFFIVNTSAMTKEL